ncbi:MAG: glutamate racemase, partial [Paramuribaculum sp.]|nr:glutamate racemase [Paramuribaculum sp.]
LKEIRKLMPEYSYIYLGDNARAPYGTRSFDVVYNFTLQAVNALFGMGCPLVILACNTASAKALRNIQQQDLPKMAPGLRVLGVIRPTAENIGLMSENGHVGILGTEGTVSSRSYDMEIAKIAPQFSVTSKACPMWVPLVENNEAESPGADYFVDKYVSELLDRDNDIDTIVLACTHYPILYPKIRKAVPEHIKVVTQGDIVAASLKDYLYRHPEMEQRLLTNGDCRYLTTENPEKFTGLASVFLDEKVDVSHIDL